VLYACEMAHAKNEVTFFLLKIKVLNGYIKIIVENMPFLWYYIRHDNKNVLFG
jgi:hypothetical protein